MISSWEQAKEEILNKYRDVNVEPGKVVKWTFSLGGRLETGLKEL